MIGSLRGVVTDRVPSIEKASAQVLLEVAGGRLSTHHHLRHPRSTANDG